MAEPSKDRDKAVEEALEAIGDLRHCANCQGRGDGHTPEGVYALCPYCEGSGWTGDPRPTFNLLWQRAQEAEREECARLVEQHTEHVEFDVFTEDEEPGTKLQSHIEPPYICSIAQAIRNRAARASEEG